VITGLGAGAVGPGAGVTFSIVPTSLFELFEVVPVGSTGSAVGLATSLDTWLEETSACELLATTAIAVPPIAVPAITNVARAELEIPICSPSLYFQPRTFG
jgi:hypothetical protein